MLVVPRRCCWIRSISSDCIARTWNGRPPRRRPPARSRANWSGVRSRRQKLVPDRLVAERGDEGPMGLAIGVRDPRWQRHLALPPRHFSRRANADLAGFGRENKLRLSRPDQVDINFGQKLGVEQRAMLGAAGIVDRIARAKGIEPVRDTRLLAPRP